VPPRGGTGKTRRSSTPGRARDGAGGWRAERSRDARRAGPPPDGDARSSIDPAYRRILGSRAQASESGSRSATATAGRPEVHVARGSAPHVCRRERPNPEPWWSELWRAREPQESTDGRSRPGQVSGSSRNGLPGGAKLRSGRAGRLRRAQCQWEVDGTCGTLRCVEAAGLSDRREPSSRLMSPGSAFGRARGRRAGASRVKAVVKIPQALRRRQSECEPARKQRPARAGAAPREGKALEGRSRNASGMEQDREASGATANGGVQKTSSEPRASRNRREGQEP
jgi:hypothetical protein